MKNIIVNYGGIILFYIVVVLGVLVLCSNSPKTSRKDFSLSSSYEKITK